MHARTSLLRPLGPALAQAATLLLCVGVACAPALAQEATPGARSKIDIPKVHEDGKGRPPIFADLSYADALAKAKSENKLLIIKFTAEWCGPCKQMDKTTWRNQDVFDWARDNAIVIAVDVDKDTKTSEQHKIKAMPTMVAYRDGVEFDRTVGYMDASTTLSWMKDVKEGKSKAAAARERAKDTKGKSVQDRMSDARSLLQADDYATALPLLIDLWNNMARDEPSMSAVRVSFFVGDIEQACTEHAPTRDAFIKIRDEDEAKLKTNPDYDTLTDWIVLNTAVGQPEKTLEWFDRVKTTDHGKATAARLFYLIDRLVRDRGDLRDLLVLERQPLSKLRGEVAKARHSKDYFFVDDPERAADFAASLWESARSEAGLLHAALILDNRVDEAAAFRAEAIKLDDTVVMRLAVVEAALEHIPKADPARATISGWAIPMLDHVDAAVKAAPDAELASRAEAARRAFAQ
jgi:thioredoxin 1